MLKRQRRACRLQLHAIKKERVNTLLTKATYPVFYGYAYGVFLKNTISLKGFIGEALELHKEHYILLFFSSLALVL